MAYPRAEVSADAVLYRPARRRSPKLLRLLWPITLPLSLGVLLLLHVGKSFLLALKLTGRRLRWVALAAIPGVLWLLYWLYIVQRAKVDMGAWRRFENYHQGVWRVMRDFSDGLPFTTIDQRLFTWWADHARYDGSEQSIADGPEWTLILTPVVGGAALVVVALFAVSFLDQLTGFARRPTAR